MERYKEVMLTTYIMFVNKLAFFVNISRHIKFSTEQMVRDQNMSTLITIVRYIKVLYINPGFIIKDILVGNQFEPMHGTIATENI